MNKKPHKAFSLLELSITILIIGILLIGVIGAKHLIKKSRITTAQNLTISSPINGILDNSLWLESSLDYKAFSNDSNTTTSNDSGNALGDGDYIENWNDNSYNQDKKSIVKVGNGPTYANTINNVQAVRFSGSDDDYLEIEDASFLNNTDYTIFVLEKRLSDDDASYFIGDSAVITDNQTLILGYSSNSSTNSYPIHSQGSTNNYTASLESYSSYSDKPRLFTFISDSTDGKKMYINGVLAEENSNTDQLSNITSLPIGKGYDGEIGEIVIFTRALKSVERKDVEDYIGKKWNNKILRNVIADCSSGTITSSGCDNNCSVNVVGSSETSKSFGSSGSISCNQTGYDSDDTTITYNCDGNVITGTCACDGGYILSGGECVQSCNVNVTGSSTTSVASGSTSVSCNATNYTGTYTFSACSAGDTVTGTCGCATGYTGAGCTACDTGYSDNNGTCEQKCTITGEAGVEDGTLVESGSTSYDCDFDGATGGTIAYTCSNGTISNITNTCVVPTCVGGNTIDTTSVPGDTIHIFTSTGSSTLTCYESVTAQVLVVGGGGGGGGNIGGGGGAGGLIYNGSYSLNSGSTTVIVGIGGSGGASGATGSNGSASSFGIISVLGGGGGGGWCKSANSGGSGGGSGGPSCALGSGTSGQGNNGGAGGSGVYAAGAGGGAGSVGGNGSSTKGGDGGSGSQNSITGSSIYYAGGGGGGTVNLGNNSGGGGGSGIGGQGGSANQVKGHGAVNTGSGGGGGGNIDPRTGGNGGSGIVIVRYTNP